MILSSANAGWNIVNTSMKHNTNEINLFILTPLSYERSFSTEVPIFDVAAGILLSRVCKDRPNMIIISKKNLFYMEGMNVKE
jgi:hypothetical protein